MGVLLLSADPIPVRHRMRRENACASALETVPTITAVLERGPLAGRRVDVDVVEGRPPKTIDVRADDGSSCRYCLADWVQSAAQRRAFKGIARGGRFSAAGGMVMLPTSSPAAGKEWPSSLAGYTRYKNVYIADAPASDSGLAGAADPARVSSAQGQAASKRAPRVRCQRHRPSQPDQRRSLERARDCSWCFASTPSIVAERRERTRADARAGLALNMGCVSGLL